MKEQKTNGRVRYLDAAKGLGLYLVMFGHISTIGSNAIDTWSRTFKLAVFFIISGWLIAYKGNFENVQVVPFIKKKARGLMIPYFWFSIIAILYQAFFLRMKCILMPKYKKLVWDTIYQAISCRGISALWFLPALFIGEVLFVLLLRKKGWMRKLIAAIISIAIALLLSRSFPVLKGRLSEDAYMYVSYPLLAISKGITGFFFMILGYGGYKALCLVKNSNIRLAIGVAATILNIIMLQYIRGTVDFNNMKFGAVPMLWFACATLGSFGAILVLEYFERFFSYPLLGWGGNNSLIIMATHTTLGFRTLLVKGWTAMAGMPNYIGLHFYVESFVIFFELLLIEYAIVELVNKKAKFLTGSSK